jgi:ribosomal protein S18 acetylase RimI-like enzyme
VTTIAHRAVTVRRATVDDLTTVVSLRLALLREHGGNAIYRRLRPDAEERARELFRAQLQSEDQCTFLADRGPATVGILRCADTPGSPLLFPARYGYLSSVYVVPEARRSGVLRALMAAAENWCRDRGLREMRLHSAPDNALSGAAWESLGFEIVEQLRMRPISPR